MIYLLVASDGIILQFLQKVIDVVVVDLHIRHEDSKVVVLLHALDCSWIAHTWRVRVRVFRITATVDMFECSLFYNE